MSLVVQEKTKLSDFTPEELEHAIRNAPPTAKLHISALKNELLLRAQQSESEHDFMKFVNII